MGVQHITETENDPAAQDAPRLAARGVSVGYGGRTVIDGLDVAVPQG